MGLHRLIHKNLALIVSLIIFSCVATADCELRHQQINDSFSFSELLHFTELQTTSELPDFLSESVWWPLTGQHSTADTRLMFSTKNGHNILQSFTYLKFKAGSHIEFGLLSLGTLKPFNLKAKDLELSSVNKKPKHCKQPKLISWNSNNPLTSETKLRFLYVGPIESAERSKIAHIEVIFPDNSRIRFVKRHQHSLFGISGDAALVKLTRSYREQHLDFRNLIGLYEFETTNICPELEDSFNRVKNLSRCFSDNLNEKVDLNNLASIHIGERNQRWVGRFNVLPAKSSGRLKELYTSIVDVSYSLKTFKQNQTEKMSYQIEFGRPAPSYVEIDPSRVPELGAINGDGNWKPESQFLNLSISYDLKEIEFEYFEIINSNRQLDHQRVIKPLYGRGPFIRLAD